jgi:MFS family permease
MTLLVLFGINTMNFYDRQVVGAVAQPLKKAWGLTDFESGALGTAFILLYAVVGLPLGRWADVGRRTHILALGAMVWSAFTAASGLAWNFWSLFAARLGVGVGEASCAPAANSLLGDLFPPARRARALSIFMLGLPLGLGLSFLISGAMAQRWGWQSALFVAGAPGFVLGLLALALPEPLRGGAEMRPIGTARPPGSAMRAVLRIPTLWWIIASGALHNFNMYALGHFLMSLLERYHGLDTATAGKICGVVYGLGGFGILLGGWLCDRAVRRRISGRLEVATLALLIATPCIFLALRQPQGDVWGFAAWLLPGSMLFYVYYSGVYASIQDIVEPALRGTAMALYFFAMYLLGAALGPIGMGQISDYFAHQAQVARGAAKLTPLDEAIGLHQAMYVVPALGVGLVLVLFAASRTVTRDYQRLHEELALRASAQDLPNLHFAPDGDGERET